jgi:hypothetical protein
MNNIESLVATWKEIQLLEKVANEKKRAIARETQTALKALNVDEYDSLRIKVCHYPAEVSPAKVLKALANKS